MAGASECRSLLCLVRPAPRLPARAQSGHAGGFASVLFHLMLVTGVALLAARAGSVPIPVREVTENRTPLQLPRIVFLPTPGPAGGGGGGGGSRQPLPPSRAESPGSDGLTAPAFAPSVVAMRSQETMLPPPQPVLEARTVAFAIPCSVAVTSE